MEGSQMTGINLRVATLKNAKLKNCNLRGATLAGTDLEVSYIHFLAINTRKYVDVDKKVEIWGIGGFSPAAKLNRVKGHGVKLLSRVLSLFN